MKKTIKITVFLSLIIIVLSSSNQSGLLSANTNYCAKQDSLTENQAIVYLFRKSAKYPMQGLRVDINNVELATFYPKKFYTDTLKTGEYVFKGYGLNTDSITLKLEKGKKYYIEVMPKLGLVITRCELKLVDSSEGEKSVQKCSLINLKNETKKTK